MNFLLPGHLPGFYSVAVAALAVSFGFLKLAFWTAHEAIVILREVREFRRGR